jgi:hypothetical protein
MQPSRWHRSMPGPLGINLRELRQSHVHFRKLKAESLREMLIV